MLGYCTLGTNDLERSAAFFDAIAKVLGHGRVMENERTVMWGSPGKGAMFGTCKPFDGEAASAGNGTMFGFECATEAQVDEIYAFALANGGSDEGPPGWRGDTFYGAYFRDPDGNKLVAYLVRMG